VKALFEKGDSQYNEKESSQIFIYFFDLNTWG